ncbi:hypothetical protein TNCV_1131371 [Trichonephila clavipes]|nr:hypothetical protein TNCV_1131371 [Trichonephila clavipes]
MSALSPNLLTPATSGLRQTHGCQCYLLQMYQFEEMIHVKYTEAKSSPKGVAWKFKEKSGPLRSHRRHLTVVQNYEVCHQ